MQAGKVGGAPHLGLEVAFSTPFRSTEGRTWQQEGEAQGVPQQPEESRGKLSGLGGLRTEETKQPGPGPTGLLAAASGAGGVGELAAAGPSCWPQPSQHYL